MNMQVWLLNSLVGLAGRVNSELTLVRCITRNGWSANSVQFSQFDSIHKVKTLSKMSYLQFISWTWTRCYKHYTACLHKLLLARIAESFEITFFYSCPGALSWKAWKLFGPIKPFSVHLYLKLEKCMRLKLLVWRESLFILRTCEFNSSVIVRFEILLNGFTGPKSLQGFWETGPWSHVILHVLPSLTQ